MNMSGSMAHSIKSISAKSVADYFLLKGSSDNKPITNKKLQKLLYYAQAWSLAARNKKLFDDKIEAWIHGPAIREIYLAYKQYGAEPITKKIDGKEALAIPEEVRNFLDEVWTVYGKFDAAYLEQLTHSEDPWQKARQGIEPNISSENEISLESMQEFYSSKLKQIQLA